MTDEPLTARERQRARANAEFAPDLHRAQPASAEAEQGTLCSILLNPEECMNLCQERGVKSAWFHSPALATVYALLVVMWQDGIPLDLVTVTQALHDSGQLESIGGGATISGLFSYLPTAANVEYYLDTLAEKQTLRALIGVTSSFGARCYAEHDDVPALLDGFEQAALSIRVTRAQSRITDSPTAVAAAIDGIQRQISRKGAIDGFATGFPELDKLTGGLHAQEFFVIAARPSQGKTALAMNIAEHLAVALALPIGVFSLEMSTEQLNRRLLCARAGVDLARVRDGLLEGGEQAALADAAAILSAAHIYYDDTAGLSIQELKAKARRMKQKWGIRALFVDYLQLVTSQTRRKEENRSREVAEVSAGLKHISKELEMPVVALAQIGRAFEDRAAKGGRPRLSDLRESGAIEQDADTVGFIVRDEEYTDDPEQKRALMGKAELIIAKQRNGPNGEVPLTFLREFTRFESRLVAYEEADAQAALIDVPASKPPRRRRAGDE